MIGLRKIGKLTYIPKNKWDLVERQEKQTKTTSTESTSQRTCHGPNVSNLMKARQYLHHLQTPEEIENLDTTSEHVQCYSRVRSHHCLVWQLLFSGSEGHLVCRAYHLDFSA